MRVHLLSKEMGGADERRETPSLRKLEDRTGVREEALKTDDTVPPKKRSISISLVSRKKQSTL